ncbi:hypothetical protein C7H73_03445 [Pulveribacter suum]|uniref:DUF2946 domain-containing protein n=2 Tax=Pulveribacter suum TaxID=2116657 RepID=A0A2P1NPG9_9BURK|nr:hypothetical protein C7H73_03445 [Pulveribacter suum]
MMARALAGRVALAWFALSMAVAVASPLAPPQAAAAASLDRVCTSAGMVEMAVAQDGPGGVPGPAHLDCPLCLPLAAPLPPALHGASPPRPVLARVLRPAPAAPIAVATAAPLSARGPPAAA